MTLAPTPAAHDLDGHPARHRADLTLHEIDGEGLVFDPMTGNTHRLNETALDIWRLCDGLRREIDIVGCLTDRYEISSEEGAMHVEQVLQLLRERGLLVEPQHAVDPTGAANGGTRC